MVKLVVRGVVEQLEKAAKAQSDCEVQKILGVALGVGVALEVALYGKVEDEVVVLEVAL